MNIQRYKLFLVPVLTVVGLIFSAQADVFQLIDYAPDQDGATLSGTIETDGSTGFLSESSILSWSYTVDKGAGNTYTLTSSDTDTETFLSSGFALYVDSGVLKLDGLLRFGRYFGGGTETALNWDSSGATKVYDSVREGNASPSGWFTENPASLGASPWAIAAIPEPSVLILLAGSGSLLIVLRRVFQI